LSSTGWHLLQYITETLTINQTVFI